MLDIKEQPPGLQPDLVVLGARAGEDGVLLGGRELRFRVSNRGDDGVLNDLLAHLAFGCRIRCALRGDR